MQWKNLRHAYGSAKDLPRILERLEPDLDSDVWTEIWSRICHQETVYSASFAALPILHECSSSWRPGERAMPLVLAGSIVGSRDAPADRDALIRPHLQLLPSFEEMVALEIPQSSADLTTTTYLLEAALAFRGDRVWSHCISRLEDGEIIVPCATCEEELTVTLGTYGFNITPPNASRSKAWPRAQLRPGQPPLPTPGDRLMELVQTSPHQVLKDWIPYLFGKGSCLHCNSEFELAERLETMRGRV